MKKAHVKAMVRRSKKHKCNCCGSRVPAMWNGGNYECRHCGCLL